jgi:FkbM family methyltransferase
MKKTIGQLLPSKIKSFLRSWIWKELSPRWTTQSGVEVYIQSPADWVLYNDIFVDHEYDKPIKDCFSSTEENPVILDLGANVGFFSLRVVDLLRRLESTVKPKIIGVEGSPRVYKDLLARTDQPPLRDLAEYHLGLVGHRSGHGTIHSPRFHAVGSTSEEAGRHSYKQKYIDLTNIIPNKDIGLIKCDIEGSEYHFVQNYKDLIYRSNLLVIEVHSNTEGSVNLEEEILHLGFDTRYKLRETDHAKLLFFQ